MSNNDYYEKKKHGTDDFPAELYSVEEKHPHYVMPLHRHSEIEFVQVISGRLELYLDNVMYSLSAGDIAIVNGGTLHRADPYDCFYRCFVFDPDMLCGRKNGAVSKYILPIVDGEARFTCHIGANDGMLYSALCAVFGLMGRKNRFFEIEVTAKLIEAIGLFYSDGLIEQAKETRNDKRRRQAITSVIDKISESYSERLTLADLACTAGLNEKYLCRIFREYTGQTPIDRLNSTRIDNACKLLAQKGVSVTEAALSVGFDDLSWFSRVFKKHKGVSPKEYRKMIDEMSF